MRRLILASALTAFCLSGCAANKDFEKEILGHPAPETPASSGVSATPPPPPAHTPQPYTPPAKSPAKAPASTTARPAVSGAQAGSPQPKPFTPSPLAPNASASPTTPYPEESHSAAPSGQPASPAPTPAPAPASATPPASAASGDRATFTFMVGAYAHADKAKELMGKLEGRGFATRMEQGKLNNRDYHRIYATKEGNRAELEGELFACGVTEPRLTEERPLDAASPAKSGKAAPPAAKVTPAAGAQPPASGKPAVKYAPPVVEPAPPLPDGYVPPPKKSGN